LKGGGKLPADIHQGNRRVAPGPCGERAGIQLRISSSSTPRQSLSKSRDDASAGFRQADHETLRGPGLCMGAMEEVDAAAGGQGMI
jgi:hypothetical protein